jgi:PKD repeat protein
MNKLLCSSLILAMAASAVAQTTLVVPSAAAAVDGNSSTSYPFDVANGRYLYVYDSTHFTNNGVTFPILISQLAVRANAATATWTGSTFNLQLDLSTSPLDFTAISTTWDNNHGLDRANVFNGSFTIAPGSSTTGTPGPFHAVITFNTPFLYDPAAGDLTIDYTALGITVANTPTCDAVTTAGVANAKRVYSVANPPAATATLWSGDLANVLEFTYTPASGLYAGFTADVTSGPSPLAVNFTDQSFSSAPGGVTGWAWDFDGDAVIDSTLQNPSFTYTNCGTYDVTLTVVDGTHGPSTLTKTAYINTDRITADFSYSQISPGLFQFTDLSSPTPTSWAWDFDGDNVVDDTTQNPVYFYTQACVGANVTLTATRLCGPSAVATKQLVIAPNTLQAATAGANGTSSTTVVGNVFDVQVTNPQGASICAVSMRPYTFTGPYNLSFYISDGSYLDLVGGVVRHQVPSAWRLVATGAGVSAGGTTTTSTQSLVSLSNTVHIPQGDYCIALLISNPAGTAYACYTTGTAANSGPFADANMVVSPNPTVAPGGAKYNLFGTGINAPRIWNGAFHYATHADDGKAQIGFAGSGCAGTAGLSALAPSGAPVLGTTLTLTASNLPLNAMIMVTGFGRYQPSSLDLTAFGAPGCLVHPAIGSSAFLIGANWTLNVPAAPAFSGLMMFNQAVVLDPTANALGVVVSDATGLVLGL